MTKGKNNPHQFRIRGGLEGTVKNSNKKKSHGTQEDKKKKRRRFQTALEVKGQS